MSESVAAFVKTRLQFKGAGSGPRLFIFPNRKALLTRHRIAAKIPHGKT
jgi:hypothetical protein